MLSAVMVLLLVSCQNKSLQKYLVEKQDDPNFVKMDFATSLLQGVNSDFSPEEQEILESIKKINFVAYPLKKGDSVEYLSEKAEVENILSQDQYQELTRIKNKDWNVNLKFKGEVDAIDELIVYANDNSKGFAVFRILGDNMRPDQMLKLMETAEKGDLDFSKFPGMGDVFKN